VLQKMLALQLIPKATGTLIPRVIVNLALARPGRYTCTSPPLLELELEPATLETYSHPFGATARESGSPMPSVIVSAGEMLPEL
jgi:hypothetical protein